MKGVINLSRFATECCGSGSKTSAISSLTSFVSRAQGPWNFDQESDVVTGAKESIGFSNGFLGVSADNKAVGFKFDNENLIGSILFADNY